MCALSCVEVLLLYYCLVYYCCLLLLFTTAVYSCAPQVTAKDEDDGTLLDIFFFGKRKIFAKDEDEHRVRQNAENSRSQKQ